MASSLKAVDNNMEDHGFNIYDDIMGNPYNEDDNNWENEGDYNLNPTPHLDTKQEAEAKALVLAAKSGDGTEKSQITKVLQGAQGKKRGKWHNGKPPQTDFKLQDCSYAIERRHAKADKAAAPWIRVLEEAQRLEAERLKWEAEELVCLQQGGHASVAPAPSSVPAPPVPAPLVPALPVPSSVPNPAQPCSLTLTPTSLEPGSPRAPTYSPVTPHDPLIVHDSPIICDPLIIHNPLVVCDPLIICNPLIIHNPLIMHDPLIVCHLLFIMCHLPLMCHSLPTVHHFATGPCLPLAMPGPTIAGHLLPAPLHLLFVSPPLLLIEPGLPLVKNSHLGVLAAWRVKPIWKKGVMYHMYLLFKDVAKQDSCRSILASSFGGKTLLPFLYMQEVYINAISTAEIQELLAVGPCPYATPGDAIPEMLNYIQYPALLDPHPAPPKHE
ncbi:hypothetical protein BS47DRAFT_1395860 [Hydnum rufescens UP504]|uniref:Uncharacterized protein n=1 Tax=Hydnum rufescens UP504 TaxID=1448309 RepID=A0A9P6DPY7_9AGAM|nr:hypothetical protein BS47DRAFT_1395860 [Hydnum rufescens UP504]